MFTIAIVIETDDRERIEEIIKGLGSVTDMMAEKTLIVVWPGGHQDGMKPRKDKTNG